ncbi:hypothetical protein [Streptomyces sp. NPDC004042]|uniref:hypothetical protein n=1 Tax=Streptomyces sp. NPDC004042 TaxID=3154451 RepID=UPI0033AFC7E3
MRRLEDGSFVLGERLGAPHGESRTQARLSRTRPVLGALRDDLSAVACLTFYEDGEIRVAEIVDGPRAPRAELWVGFENAGHATALGKRVLRELDDEVRGEYLSRPPPADLPRTVTRRTEPLRRLDASGWPARRPRLPRHRRRGDAARAPEGPRGQRSVRSAVPPGVRGSAHGRSSGRPAPPFPMSMRTRRLRAAPAAVRKTKV